MEYKVKLEIGIEAWLCDRHQTVVVEGERSPQVHVKSGVPQGTVLGPLIFLLYISDIGDWVISQMRLFADDSLLHGVITNMDDARSRLQEDLTIK
jgi:hypothetical protein